jgi:hypothetical protein
MRNPAILLFASFACLLNGKSQAQPASPLDPWLGTWAGQLYIYKDGAVVNQASMELRILPSEQAGRWHWEISYLGAKADLRPYELLAIAPERGHYQIDEKNTILLDMYLTQDIFSSIFSVDNTLLIARYSLRGGHILFEITSLPLDQALATGEGIEEADRILSYPLGVYQQAVLNRQ